MKRRRRGRNEGSIFEREDGLWVGSVSLGRDGDGKRKRRTVYGKSKADVQTKVRELQAMAETNVADAGNVRVGEFLQRWLAMKIGTVQHHTYTPYADHVRRYLIPHLGQVKLAKLSSLHVEGLYTALTAAGVSAAMQRKAGTTLRCALQHAVHPLRLIPHNPAVAVKKPRHTAPEMQVLDPDQVQQLLAAARSDRLSALYTLAVDSIAREGELFALTWADVDFEGAAITVTKTLEETASTLRVKDTKTKKSRRRIALSAFTMTALADHRKAMLAEGHYGPDKPVFCDTTGGHLRKSNFLRRSFHAVLKRANAAEQERAEKVKATPRLLPSIRPYDLRHTGATLLLIAGESPKVVSERLGHSTTSLTMDTYSHTLPGMQERAAAKIDAILRAGTQPERKAL